MDSRVISQINQIVDCTDDLPYKDVASLIHELTNPNRLISMRAREALICIGKSAVPELVNALAIADTELRLQIIKVLEIIQDASSISILVEQLKNDHAGVRWAASNALIGYKREAMPALLAALTHDFDCLGLRLSAHHILHVFKDDGRLTEDEEKVYHALEEAEPTSSVPWAASKALIALQHSTKKPLQ